MNESARPRLLAFQLLRSLESRGLLQLTAAECLDKKKFTLVHHVFQRGVDCGCDCAVRPPPELEVWEREYAAKPKERAGTVVCVACHEVDVAGVHDPVAM